MQIVNLVSARALALAFSVLMGISLNAQHFPLTKTSSLIDHSAFEEEFDTLSLFQLIDSLLLLEASRSSQFSIHFGYTSEVSNAGRTLEVKQFGFNPGISYFHKSGVYADVSGYWNSQLDPNYDLTVISLGYLGLISQKFSFSVSYDHSFFTDNDPQFDLPPRVLELLLPPILNNSLTGGLDLDLGFIEGSVDYGFLFNDKSAHRLQWSITGDLKKRNILKLDRVAVRPAVSLLYGNQDIISISYSRDAFTATRFPFVINKENAFGLMNYQLSLPLLLTKKPFHLVFEYNYNIPQSLPGEKYQYQNNSFFSIDLYYTFGIGPKKSIFE